MNVIQIGQFTLQGDLLVLIGTILLAGIAMVLRLMMERKSTRLTIDWLITVLVFMVLNMKFGYLWDSPSVIWEQPRALLFLSGTSVNGNILLVIGLLAWSVTYIRKHKLSVSEFIDTLTHGMLMAVASYGILHAYMGHEAPGLTLLKVPEAMADSVLTAGLVAAIPAIESIIALFMLIILWMRKKPLGSYADTVLAAPLFGTAGMIISYFHVQDSLWLGLSFVQWFYVLILVVAYMVFRFKERSAVESPIMDSAVENME